jgi:hypothetical protein
MAFRGGSAIRLAPFTGGVRALVHDYSLAAASWSDDVGRDTKPRDVRLDVASPGSAGATATNPGYGAAFGFLALQVQSESRGAKLRMQRSGRDNVPFEATAAGR